MSTAKKEETSRSLIIDAIDASIEFEKIMDRIDFDSYFEKEKNKTVMSSDKWDVYTKKIDDAKESFNKILERIEPKLCEKKRDFHLECEDTGSNQYLIYELIKAKKTRLQAKQKIRKQETMEYIDATHKLHEAFDRIPKEYFDYQKDKQIIDNFNWAKILYYNELAICYSGLAKSSMSLGYAEQSISLLEELYPKLKKIKDLTYEKLKDKLNELNNHLEKIKKEQKFEEYIQQMERILCSKKKLKNDELIDFIVEFYDDILEKIEDWNTYDWKKFYSKLEETESSLPFSQVIKLYTFALYNKGEAERLLHNDDLALRTFRRINEFSIFVKDTDNNSALLRKALILNDMGRGKEALETLSNIRVSKNNSQFVEKKLEQASVFIDSKRYYDAYEILKDFDDDIKEWEHTFARRKARVFMLRLLNEFKKNKIEDFQKAKNAKEKLENAKKKKNLARILVLEEYPKLDDVSGSILEDLLKESIERQDGGNFKKICAYLAEYFKQEYKNIKKLSRAKKIEFFKKSRKYFYLYLFEKYYFDNKNKSRKELINEFTKELFPLIKGENLSKILLYAKKNNIDFSDILCHTEDESYLEGFFNLYFEGLEANEIKLSKDEENFLIKIKETLIDIYFEMDNMIELEAMEEKYSILEGKHFNKQNSNILEKTNSSDEKEKSKSFIKYFYFRNRMHCEACIKNCMQPDHIVEQMQKNTQDFEERVVGKSCFPFGKGEKIAGRLCVLRRWNSFTPTLGSSSNPSKGGGYFLYFSINDNYSKGEKSNKKKSLGIVIDPGYDFLENFFSQGFRIADIDVLLVSHAHPDHTNDLPSILSLFHEMNGRLGKDYRKNKKIKETNKKTLTLVLSPGVFEQYNHIIKPSEEDLEDIRVVNLIKGAKPEVTYEYKFNNKYNIEIKAFGTSHKDLSKFQSLGFKIIFNAGNTQKAIIGYTGDARWNNDWPNQLKDCTIVCAHLGSIVNILDKKDFCNTFCDNYKEDSNRIACKNLSECKNSGFSKVKINKTKLLNQTRNENHLYLTGLTFLFNYLMEKGNLKLGIISEFGEELKYGIRIDLYKKFDAWLKQNKNNKKIKCLPGDIGLEIDVFNEKIYCYCCERYVDMNTINPLTFTKEEAICYICDECKKVLSTYQIGEKLKCYCENGRKLELADE